ncbi:MAG: hypothetical protein II407_08355 [Prevotella sp.]|nr:hypothetical protein [Prevotella sp.]
MSYVCVATQIRNVTIKGGDQSRQHITVGSGEAAMRPEWEQTVICTADRSGPDRHITDCPGVTQTSFRQYPTSPLVFLRSVEMVQLSLFNSSVDKFHVLALVGHRPVHYSMGVQHPF